MIILLFFRLTLAELTLSPHASWDQNGVTIAGTSNGTSGPSISQLNLPLGISIASNDILYIGDTYNHRVVVVNLNSANNISIIGSGPGNGNGQFNQPFDVSVKNTSLYVIDFANHRLQKVFLNDSNRSMVSRLTGLNWPYYLYVDNNENIYLSDTANHRVLFFPSNSNIGTVVAGTGVAGSNNSQLYMPFGLFVNQNGTIYVADCYNHRIMKWLLGASAGVIAAGNGTSGPDATQLFYPTQVIVDTNECMYITESNNLRVTRWKTNSTFGECIAACTGTSGTASNQLNGPHSLAFDSHGSLYVNDRFNHRVQKFQILLNNSLSYNLPILCPTATWNPNAITIANASMIDASTCGIFTNINNTIYITDSTNNRVHIWQEENMTLVRTMSSGLNSPRAIFVMRNGDMYVNGMCFGLFIDIDDYLYCSTESPHQVVKKFLNSAVNTSIIAAGNGTAGSASTMLIGPRGMFVDRSLNLYVADCWNNRVQLFQTDQPNGTTVAINGSNGIFILNTPTDVALDNDGYLFIVDYHNNRILGAGSDGFRCIVGCTGINGSAPNQLSLPHSLSFDSYGNLLVIDVGNVRLQKFLLTSNFCADSTNDVQSTTASIFTSEKSTNTISDQHGKQASNSFLPPLCLTSAYVGTSCNISALSCDLLQPCQNNGTCINNNTALRGYICSCSPGFHGPNCQISTQQCRSGTCWNNGTCYERSNTTFLCQCAPGWLDNHCQTKTVYCQQGTCLNRGVCRPLLLNYICQCLSGSYSGRYCDITTNKLVVRQTISKSLAYVAIIAMIGVAMFVIVLDVLKYFLGIDPVGPTRKKLQSIKGEKKKKKRSKKPVTIIRCIYVHAASQLERVEPISTIGERTVVSKITFN